MTGGKPDFNQILKAELNARDSSPLSPEELEAWRSGDLDERERLALQERLILDRDAVCSLLSLEADEGRERVSKEESRASWSQFEKKLDVLMEDERRQGTRQEEFLHGGPRSEKAPWFFRMAGGLAAALMLATILLVFQVLRLSRERDALLKPSLTTAVHTVYLGDVETRGGEAPLGLSNRPLTLRLVLSRRWEPHDSWRVNLIAPGGKLVHSEDAVAEDQALTLSLRPEFFSSGGVYRVEIAGLKNGEATHLDGFDLRIEL